MNRSLTHSFPAKVGGVFLSVILAFLLVLSGAGILAAWQFGIYESGVSSYYDTDACYYELLSDLYTLQNQMKNGITKPGGYYGDLESCNLRFAGYDPQTGRYLSNDSNLLRAMEQIVAAKLLSDDSLQLQYSDLELALLPEADVEPDAVPTVEQSADGRYLPRVIREEINGVWFIAGVVDPLPARDAYFRQHRLFSLVYSTRVLAPVLLAVCVFAFAADLIFLCCAAGHRSGKEEITLNTQDKIPLDLYLFAMFWAGFLLLYLLVDLLNFADPATIVLAAVMAVGFFLVCLATLLTLCTRFKVGKWWRNTVIYLCWRLFLRICRAIGSGVRSFFTLLPMVWRTAFLTCALLFFQSLLVLLMFQTTDGGGWLLVAMAFDGLLLLAAMRGARHLQMLRSAGAALAQGDFDSKVDTQKMRGALKEHGEHLNSLGQGLSIAVEQKLRSERLKTELITNVSHDIKTPLTSIINYVDLLQKSPAPEEQAEYLAVLDRQAKRLKKLTEDLVEASKASTGNLPVHLAPTNLKEIIDQAIGEYEDRLTAAGLEPVIVLPQEGLSVLADGRLLWRVLDNLLNNACKYAQSGTRLYVEAAPQGDRAFLSMKNISRQQLNLSPDELMERFVRGDSSRNTEGSGLGLNIAKSLVELQQGKFTLAIDGDLFKAVISLPLCMYEESPVICHE